MADGPKDFRDPVVHDSSSSSSGGIGKWIGIAVAVLIALLLLSWLLGLFGNDEAVVTEADDPAVVVVE